MIERALKTPHDSVEPSFSIPAASNALSTQDWCSPLSADGFFETALTVAVNSSDLFRVYLTRPKAKSGSVLFVFHHGAGYSALSAACFAKEVNLQSLGEFGVMSYDCRGHGSSKVGSLEAGPPDLSLTTLSKDLVNLLVAMYPTRVHAPSFVLIGHSMGGAVVTEACPEIQAKVGRVIGLVILDVVEGSALRSLKSMMPLIESRPSTFKSTAQCIEYHLRSHTLRNPISARISVPTLITPCNSSAPLTESANDKTDCANPTAFKWITDLRSSQQYWEGWFRGLSTKFLERKTARLLVLAGTDRLDKDLLVGQMQGKYQLCILPNVGHCLHEDDPAKLAETIVAFARRNDTSGNDEILARVKKMPLPSCSRAK